MKKTELEQIIQKRTRKIYFISGVSCIILMFYFKNIGVGFIGVAFSALYAYSMARYGFVENG